MATTTDLAQRGEQRLAFHEATQNDANDMLTTWVGEGRANEAAGRIAAALSAAAASARNPADFYACTPDSVSTVIALSALTGLMPGTGPTALAYAVPRRPRRGEEPQLQYMLSHRGLNALARRCGQTVIPIPISVNDVVDVNAHGELRVISRDIDDPPMKHDDLRGVMVIVRELSTGATTASGFVSKAAIEARRAMSDSWGNERARQYSPWTKWPVEMAMKTAIHYAAARGWCVIDDTIAARAIEADAINTYQHHDERPSPQVIPAQTRALEDVMSDEPGDDDITTLDGVLEALADCKSLEDVEAVSGRTKPAAFSEDDRQHLRDNFEAARGMWS